MKLFQEVLRRWMKKMVPQNHLHFPWIDASLSAALVQLERIRLVFNIPMKVRLTMALEFIHFQERG